MLAVAAVAVERHHGHDPDALALYGPADSVLRDQPLLDDEGGAERFAGDASEQLSWAATPAAAIRGSGLWQVQRDRWSIPAVDGAIER